MPHKAPPDPDACADRQRVADFMHAWSEGRHPTVADFAPDSESPDYQATLRELIVRDLELRWKQPVTDDQATLVRPPTAESYIRQFALTETPELADEIAKEEFIVRRRFGDAPELQEFVNRFPNLEAAFKLLDQRYPLASNSSPIPETSWRGVPQLANYEIIRPLGEGGMGTVYFARQLEPVRRDVALKVIRCGTDSPELIIRFEAERQALAIMDDPHIAKVLDGGVTQTGLPYFAMEYVDGKAITDYCHETAATLEQRLELFVQTCHAVQHAHQKGVLHRDLKPSNILVTSGGSEGANVKVIDFGLAKAVRDQATLTDQTLQTQLGQVVGTPQYMSPEQASAQPMDVDTRSDVFSLGTVLYELLAGTPPLERSFLQSQALDEILRAIREVEPEKPSQRVKRDGRDAESGVANWSTSKLGQSLSGDLDWIVMRALEKDRERRYESPLAIAQDVERYRKVQPVLAGPPSTLYRVRKFVRRFAVSLSIAATFLGLLCGAAIVTSVLGWRAIEAEQRAYGNLQTALRQEAIAVENEAIANQLAIDSQHQAASLALRQAEASMDSSDVPQGLLWYLNALQMAPENSPDLRRVARWNLQAWSRHILPVTHRRATGEVFYSEEGSPFLYEQTEMVGNDIFAMLEQPPKAMGADSDSSQTPAQSEHATTQAAAYVLFNGDTFLPKFPPISPAGLPLDYWIDSDSRRLITLHIAPAGTQDAGSGNAPDGAEEQATASTDLNVATVLGRAARSGNLTVEQWDLETGKPLAKPILLTGGFLDSIDSGLTERSVEVDWEHNHLFHFAPAERVARLYDLASAELLQPAIACVSADLSRDGFVLASGHEDGRVVRYLLRDGQFQEQAAYQVKGDILHVQASNSVLGGKCSDAVMAIEQDRQVHVWDRTGHQTSEKTAAAVRGLRASGDILFVGLSSGAIAGWNVATNETSLLQYDCDYSTLRPIHQGRFWAISDGSELKVWDHQVSFSRPVFQAQQAPQSANSNFVLNLDVDPHTLILTAGFLDGQQRYFQIDPESTSPELLVREIPVEPSAAGAYVQAVSQVHGRCRLISRINVEDKTEILDCTTGQVLATIANSGLNELWIPIGPSQDGEHLNCFSISAEDATPSQLLKVPLRRMAPSSSTGGATYFLLNAHPTRQAVLAIIGQRDSALVSGEKLVTLGASGELSLHDLTDGSVVDTVSLESDYQWELLIPSQSRRKLLAASNSAQVVQLLNSELQALGPILEFAPGPDSPRFFTLACHPGLTHIFVPASRETIDLVQGSKLTLDLDPHLEIEAAAFDLNGRRLAISCSDATLRIMDFPSLKVVEQVRLPSVARRLQPLAKGTWLAVMSARQWHRIDGNAVVEGGTFAQPLVDAKLSTDGKLMVSLHTDDSLQLWDTSTARRIGPRRRFHGRYLQSQFLASDAHFAILTEKQILVVPLKPDEPLPSDDELTRRVQNLTHSTVVDGRMVRLDKLPSWVAATDDQTQPDQAPVEFWRITGNQSTNTWPDLMPTAPLDRAPPPDSAETSAPFIPVPYIDPSA